MPLRKINTVLGSIHPDELGITAMHEHILWGPYGWQYDPEWWYHVPKVYQKCSQDLVEYGRLGGKTLVDLSGIGLGRNINFYVEVSQSSRVNVVVCTGFWAERGIPCYFQNRDVDYYEELFIRELTVGIEGTPIKAGIIKVGNNRDEITELEEILYRAAARASKKTGASVTTHGVESARHQVEIFLDEKVDPERIIIAHCDAANALDFERDKEIAKRGFNVAYDHIGIDPTWSPQKYALHDDVRADMVKAMIGAGHIKKLLLSCDVNSFSLGWQKSSPVLGKSVVGDLFRFLPRLHRIGVTTEQFLTMVEENPAEVLPF